MDVVPGAKPVEPLQELQLFFGVEAIGDENSFDTQTRAQIFDDRLGHADDSVRLAQDMSFDAAVQPPLDGEGPRRARRLERPAIAKLGDPGDSPTFEGEADHIGSLANGKQADIVVVRGDPSTNIQDIENVEVVFKDGIGYDSAKLIESAKGQVGIR